ncbi:MAG: PqqD family peptide modification chaperone [Erysipelotrichaceae bacterium]|nr:PqqD family peptide modification chaperone [Erysipelotrichaceae bacterium]
MFKKNEFYTLQDIAGDTYLLPYGQALAEQRYGFKMNETGLYLWEKLDTCNDKETLVEYLHKEKGIKSNVARYNVDQFVDRLIQFKVIKVETPSEDKPCKILSIANINLGLYGDPIFFYRDELKLFERNAERINISFTVKVEYPDFVQGKILIRTPDLIVEEGREYYILRYPKQKYIHEVRFTKDGVKAFAYVFETGNDTDRKLIGDVLHNAMRVFFLYYAKARDCYAINSASILYKDKAWLFSGPSGSGKSTHVELWQRLFDVECLNGDINLVVIEGKNAYVLGTPWCGSSRIYTNRTVDLGGIIFLAKDIYDHVEELDQSSKAMMISQRMITPAWTEKMLEENIEFANRLKNLVLVCKHYCTKNFEAVGVIKQRIDESKYEYAREPDMNV